MKTILTYGNSQQFRFRQRDINIVGRVEGSVPPYRKSSYQLNSVEEKYFYIETVTDKGLDWTYQYKESPSVNRLKDVGDFNLEIPISNSYLKEGDNYLEIVIEDSAGHKEQSNLEFTWDPQPVTLPLDLKDVSHFDHIQEIGQVVNGAFDLDKDMNLIRSRAPVYPDALLVLGSPYGSQEAIYNVRFTDFTKVKWLGPSDFFVGHEGPVPSIGIKPGWSTCGMACISPRWEARSFLAFGDHSGTKKEWVVQTAPPKRFCAEADVLYRVRHQIIFKDGINRVRYRIWPEEQPEPENWLCEEDDSRVSEEKPRFIAGSFALFQHSGMPIEWSNIQVNELE